MNNSLEHKNLTTNKLEAIPQFDIDVENAVLYCLFHSKEARESLSKINEKDFYDNANKQLFSGVDFSSKDFDILTIPLNVKINKAYLRLFGENYLLSNFDIYYHRLKELSARRDLENICYNTVVKVREYKDLNEIKNTMVKEIEDININVNKDIVSIKEVDLGLEEYYRDINKKIIKTGFGRLDSFISGFQKGVFYVIGGVPGVGKTTFALNLTNNICKQNYNVLFISLEMPYREVEGKLISEIAGIDTNRIKRFESEKDENIIKKINEAREKIYDYNLKFIGSKGIFIYEIDDVIKNIGNINIVFIDYLQSIRTREGINRYEKVSNISLGLQTLALKHDIPIVTISSLRKGQYERVNKEPVLEDLKDSREIEYNAGVVLFLHRSAQFDSEAERDKAKIILAKNRYGVSNIDIDLVWKPEISKFYEKEIRYENGSNKRKDIFG